MKFSALKVACVGYVSVIGLLLGACQTSQTEALQRSGSTASSSRPALSGGQDCKQAFTPVYLPPTKVGGAGRTSQVPNGKPCKDIKSTPSDANTTDILEARLTSDTPGAVASVYSTKLKKLPELCVTPCTLNLDKSLKWRATVLMEDGSNHVIPVPFHAYEKKGVEVKFSPKNPLDVNVRFLGAPPFNAATAITDRDAQPLVRIPVPGPMNVKQSGRCKVRFDVTPRGMPSNISVISCSDPIYLTHAVENVAKYTYAEGSNSAWLIAVEQSVVFKLFDKNGKAYPE